MVATVVNLTSASSTVHYFRREGHGLGANLPANENGAGEDYYARRDDEHRKASRWWGSGAAALGLKGHVPGTDIRLGRLRDGEHEHRPGLDITLSAPKSVSLEALLGGPASARACGRTTRRWVRRWRSLKRGCSGPGAGTGRSGARRR